MAIPSLRQSFQAFGDRHRALGHFNFSDLVVLKAVADTARQLDVPVVAGVSEGEREFVGVRQAAALVRSYREEYGQPIYLNADHTHSLEKALVAARAGFDSIVFDLSKLPFEENAKQTKQAVEALKSINPDIIVEAEVGYIGSSSTIHDATPQNLDPLTTPEQAKQFVDETKIDAFAPSVGTTHGMLKSMLTGKEHKHLDLNRIREIKAATGVFLTLHGGSGTATQELAGGVEAGLNLIHINTELRVAWRRGIESALKSQPDEVTPYRLLPVAYDNVAAVIRSLLELVSVQAAQPRSSTAAV
ncbi:MAG TPA: class II fructose-bisphosphate aldolase [Candidatus Acidoferrum sp.]|jgi:fructose-bisphosphate aldolase class II